MCSGGQSQEKHRLVPGSGQVAKLGRAQRCQVPGSAGVIAIVRVAAEGGSDTRCQPIDWIRGGEQRAQLIEASPADAGLRVYALRSVRRRARPPSITETSSSSWPIESTAR